MPTNALNDAHEHNNVTLIAAKTINDWNNFT